MWYLNADFLLAIFCATIHFAVFSTKDKFGDIGCELMSFVTELSAGPGDFERVLTGSTLCRMNFEVVERPVFLIVDWSRNSSDSGKVDSGILWRNACRRVVAA